MRVKSFPIRNYAKVNKLNQVKPVFVRSLKFLGKKKQGSTMRSRGMISFLTTSPNYRVVRGESLRNTMIRLKSGRGGRKRYSRSQIRPGRLMFRS